MNEHDRDGKCEDWDQSRTEVKQENDDKTLTMAALATGRVAVSDRILISRRAYPDTTSTPGGSVA